MLIDYEYKGGKLIVSHVGEDGSLQIKHFDWKKLMKYQVTDFYDPKADTVYKAWDGRKIKQVPFSVKEDKLPDRYATYNFLDSLPTDERDEIFKYREPNIYFCDIETEIVDTGFVEPRDASSRVLSIALVHKNKTMILGIKPLKKQEMYFIQDETNRRLEKFNIKYNVNYVDFSQHEHPEREMLDYFFKSLVPRIPVLTGWNFVNYDWTFLVNRAYKIGVDPTHSSPTRRLVAQSGFRDHYDKLLPMHRVIVDYMDLFKKWDTSIKIRESFSLDFVAEKVLGGEGKVHYTGGLQNLYDNDYKMYLFYNVIDTILVQMIHEKMKYINIMYAISALSRIRTLDALSALRVTEGLLREDFKNKKNIQLCRDYTNIDFKKPTFQTATDDVDTSVSLDNSNVKGGYVKDPNKGLNKWVACYDFASLYPTTQRQNNIAPENFKGQKQNSQYADFNGRRIEIQPEDVICANGAVFDRNFSVTCNKLTEIYNDRKKYKKQMLKAKDELKKLQNELSELSSVKAS